MKRHLETVDGVVETFHADEDRFAIQRTADVEPVIEDVHASHMATGGWSPSRELRHIAEIPEIILQNHAQSRGIENYMDLLKTEYRGELLALICDSDFRAFSPSGGKV